MRRLHGANWLIYVLISSVVVLALTGVALLGAYFYLSRQTNADDGPASPQDAVRPEGVAPDLAVLTLAGEPEERVIRAALDAKEYDTAYADLAYSLLLPDAVRSGHWLLLASYYQKREPARALLGFRAALDQAALSPTLGDLARADISLQVARGLAALDRPVAAKLAAAQAENVARYSTALVPAQRQTLLRQVADAFQALGDAQTAAALRAKTEAVSAGPGVQLEQGALLLPELRGSVVLPASVAQAMVARQRAAATMAARWLSSAPSGRAALAEDLGRALQAEDEARADFYAQAVDLAPADRLALHHDRVAWLTIKLRVARGAYGVALAPDWAAQTEDVRADLVAAYTDLINGYGQALDSLSAAEAVAARVELLRQGVLWCRLGLFPGDAEAALSEQLTEAGRQLWTRQGGAGLTIVAQQEGAQRYYLLSGAEAAR